jgi:alpha-L-fucosidase
VEGRLRWWREAGFGLFVHWGLYALPGGEWKGESGHAEWIRDTARIPLDEYGELANRFEAREFDPREWVRLAREAGMRYVVFTSKHHDGFCLFPSRHTDWTVAQTPFGRDAVGELAEACAAEGMPLGLYYSIMDWHHPDYLPRREWEDRPVEGADFERYVEYLHAQVSELVTRYDPAILWFDGEWESTWTMDHGRALYDLCRSLSPKMIVNNRVADNRGGSMESFEAPVLGDFATPEQYVPTEAGDFAWETCMTMNRYWGWNRGDREWKSASLIRDHLRDVNARGGNLLLNVGPTETGAFPEEAVRTLRELAG